MTGKRAFHFYVITIVFWFNLMGFSACKQQSAMEDLNPIREFHNKIVSPASQRLDPYTDGVIPDSVLFIRLTYSPSMYFSDMWSVYELSFTGTQLVVSHMLVIEKDSATTDLRTMNMSFTKQSDLVGIKTFVNEYKKQLLDLNADCEICSRIADGRIAFLEYRVNGKFGHAFDASINILPSDRGIPESTKQFHHIEQAIMKLFEPVKYFHWMEYSEY